jgi:hypothetical protein
MWKWEIRTGTLSHDGKVIFAGGYSGLGEGVNNPAMEAVRGEGPIPEGLWTFTDIAQDNHTGPFSIRIAPLPGTVTHGRDGFRCHGDNKAMNHTASHGCIILPPAVRHQIWDSGDRELEVVA